MKNRTRKILQVWGDIPNPTEEFFYRNGVQPHRALRDITYTPEIEAAIIAREAAVVGDRWQIVGENSDITELVKNNIMQIRPTKIIRSIMESIWYGFTVLEHPMICKDGKWFFEKISSLPCEWFRFNEHQELIVSPNLEEFGDISSVFKHENIGDLSKEGELVQYRSSYLNPYGESQLARVFWSATWLRGDMELWANYIDRFGDDSILARTEVSSPEKRQELLQAIIDFRSSGGMVVEGTDEFSLIKSDKSSSAELFKSFHEVCVNQINKLILGHSSALDSTQGKLGNDQGLSLVRKDITNDDKNIIAETMNRMIQHLCLVNNWDIVRFVWAPEENDESMRIIRDQKIVEMGFQLTESYIRKAYNFDTDDIILKS
ncbi:MAG: phage portal protein family protein [Brevinemataceae bacterium]